MFFKKNKDANASNDDKIKVDTSTITTMIGSDTVFNGTLKTKASVRINGTVNGDVRADGIVILTKNGHIEGTIEAESIIVAGRIDGNMSIRDKVNVEPSGQIYGEIITKKFVIDEESVFEGNVVMNRDGKVIPVTPYKSEMQLEEEKRIENEINEKAEKLLKEKLEKLEKDKKDKDDKDGNGKSGKNKDEKDDKSGGDKDNKDKEDKDKPDKDGSDKPDEEDKKPDDKDKDGDKPEKDDDAEKTGDDEDDAEQVVKDSEIIIADINEIKDGEDIPKTEVKTDSDKKGSVKKSKSLSVEVQNE